jgi:bifunctional DNA-binding transcriptional regulator/antitoxin component of YhaV-PrlF toxin-antitoxin module
MQEQTRVIRPLRNGQITIPVEFRRQMQIDENTLLQIVLDGNELRIRTMKVSTKTPQGSAWARDLYEMFTPVRETVVGHSEAEVDADIDKAIAAVRRKRGSRRH